MKSYLLFLAVFLLPIGVSAQGTGTVRGTVTSQVNNAPLANVSVQLSEIRRSVETDGSGAFEFANVPPGRHTIVTHFEGFSDQARSIVVPGGSSLTQNFTLSIRSVQEEVTVTATGTEQSVYEAFQTVNSVGGSKIAEQANTAIGEVLERESGIGKRSFGPGTGRPIIRGFDGDRVLVLQDGVRTGSVGSQSGDHGEPIDTMALERVEVIKGPATLLYGSNAIGGVVNAVTNDEDDAHEGFRGFFTGLGATNNRQGGVGAGVEYGYKKWVLNGSGNFIGEGDYRTPLGQVPNSGSRSFGGKFGTGYYSDKFFAVGEITADKRRYGVPYAPLFEEGALLTTPDGDPCGEGHHGEDIDESIGEEEPCQYDPFAIQARFANQLPEVPDEAIDIRMRRNNYRFRGGFRDVRGPIAQGNFFIDFTDYRHAEIETFDGEDEIATTFDNDTFSYRAMFQQAKYGKLSGRFGFDGYRRSYLTLGAESLIDGRVRQNNFAAFTLQEVDFDRVAFQFGGRIEHNGYNPANNSLYGDRSFTGFSGAAGVRFRLWEGASFVTNFTSSYRAPALEELYNFGPHIGTVTFEIGDQDLTRERSSGIEFSFRQQLDRVRINGSFFHYRINDFVFLSPVDDNEDGLIDVEDNLPISAFVQDDATFTGADISADVDITKWLGGYVSADIVKAELRDGNIPLPRITPARGRLGLDFRYKGLSVRPEAVFVGPRRLDGVSFLETPTAGYGLFNLNASYSLAKGTTTHTIFFASSNLGDRLYRNHLSFIKDLAPEPGRGVRAGYTIRFF
ncbi:MAG: TonB-dependent receptor [bacterium]|nr:TonB-dependent receptor [bacterium]